MTATGSLTGLVTNHDYVLRRIPVALATSGAGAASIVGSLLKARLQHHGPLGDLAEETANRGGEAAAERILRRAVRVVTRIWTFPA